MFYDENTLYFETAKTDNLREPGFSKDGYNFEQKRDSGERLSPEYARKSSKFKSDASLAYKKIQHSPRTLLLPWCIQLWYMFQEILIV